MSLNLKSSLAPLEVGPAPSGPSLSSVKIPQQQGYTGSGLSQIGTAILPGIGTAVGAIGDSLLGYFSQRSANKANAKLAEYQNKWNLEQWKRENDYNKPLNQLRRYEEAGINPMLAMGNMDTGNAPALESAPMANQQAFTNFTGFQNLNQNLLAKEANDINRYNAHTNRIDVMASLPTKKREALKLDNEIEQINADINKIKAEEYRIYTEADLSREKVNYQRTANLLYDLYGDDEYIANIQQATENAEFNRESRKWLKTHALAARRSSMAALKNVSNQAELYKQLAKEAKKRVDNFNVQVDKWVAEGKLTKENAEYMKKENEHYEENQKLKWIQAAVGAANALGKMDFVSTPEI